MLTEMEREELERRSRSQAVAHRDVVRAKLVLLLASGQSVSAVSREVGLARRIVVKWAERFSRKRVNG